MLWEKEIQVVLLEFHLGREGGREGDFSIP
jgi:hypothetical protein